MLCPFLTIAMAIDKELGECCEEGCALWTKDENREMCALKYMAIALGRVADNERR